MKEMHVHKECDYQ